MDGLFDGGIIFGSGRGLGTAAFQKLSALFGRQGLVFAKENRPLVELHFERVAGLELGALGQRGRDGNLAVR